jgi:hypothetical protein
MILVRRKIDGPTFWVSNINQKRDIMLGDLRVTVRAGRTINLLDSRHYHFTIEQLRASAKNGSIFKKGRWIKVREGSPQQPPTMVQEIVRKRRVLQPLRTSVDVDAPSFEELDFIDSAEADSAFAEEQADAAFQDHAPALAVDKKYLEKPEDEEAPKG